MSQDRSPSPSRSRSPSPNENDGDGDTESTWSFDAASYWTVQMMELPTEVIAEIFMALPDYRDVVALRLCSRQLENIYQAANQSIFASLRSHITAPFKELYDFLVRLRLPEGAVHHPPPSGWPNIGSDPCSGFDRTPFAINVLKHLSYVGGPSYEYEEITIGNKSDCIDYSAFGKANFDSCGLEEFWGGEWQGSDDGSDAISGLKHIVMIANGRETYGVVLLLDTFTGTIFEEIVRCESGVRLSARDYCDRRMEQLRNLEDIFIPGSEETVEQPHDAIPYDAEAMELQGEPPLDVNRYHGSDENYYWLRHLYRKAGWPGPQWRKEECLAAVKDYARRHDIH